MEYISLLSLVLVAWCCLTVTVSAQNDCVSENCRDTTGDVCNGHGTCDCGTCRCEGSYHGPTCEECPTCKSPCEIYSGCVSCKIFSTGQISFMECLQVCDSIATFHPVETAGDFHKLGQTKAMHVCQRINEWNCQESFKIGGMSTGYRDLFVKLDMDCDIELEPEIKPTTTETTTTEKLTTAAKSTTTTEKKTTEKKKVVTQKDGNKSDMEDNGDAKTYGKAEEADVVSGSSEGSDSRDNGSGSSRDFKFSAIMCLCIFLIAIL